MGTSSAWRFRWLTTNHLWIEDFPAQNYSIHPSINNSRDLNCRHKAKVKGLTCWVEAHHYFLSGWKFTQQAVNISYLFMISGIDWSFNCKLPAKNGDEHQQNGFKLPKSGDSWGTAEPPCKKTHVWRLLFFLWVFRNWGFCSHTKTRRNTTSGPDHLMTT